MTQFGLVEVWRKYADRLTWGRGQCMAILDDGCDLTVPQWQAKLPWGPKVVAGYDSIDDDDDPTPVPPGYHGTTVGYPSSLNHEGICGVAYNNTVAQVRSVSIVHLVRDESPSLAAALQWVIDRRGQYNITAINLSCLDDIAHTSPVPTVIDAKLATLRELNVWVSAPCGNNGHSDGISWPACQSNVFGIGAVRPGTDEAINDRYANTALLVPAVATSSSNAYAAGSSMLMREAIEKSGYDWRRDGATIPEAIMAIFQQTGVEVNDPATALKFKRLNLLAAVEHVL
jgi:hypothetical protein